MNAGNLDGSFQKVLTRCNSKPSAQPEIAVKTMTKFDLEGRTRRYKANLQRKRKETGGSFVCFYVNSVEKAIVVCFAVF